MTTKRNVDEGTPRLSSLATRRVPFSSPTQPNRKPCFTWNRAFHRQPLLEWDFWAELSLEREGVGVATPWNYTLWSFRDHWGEKGSDKWRGESACDQFRRSGEGYTVTTSSGENAIQEVEEAEEMMNFEEPLPLQINDSFSKQAIEDSFSAGPIKCSKAQSIVWGNFQRL